MSEAENGNNKVLWWLMGIVAFVFTGLAASAFQNLRYDLNDLRATAATRREHVQIESTIAEMRQIQTGRNERGAILDSIVSDIRSDLTSIKTEIKDLREFLYRQYGGMPPKKPVPPSDY